jgi:hypothetical protein
MNVKLALSIITLSARSIIERIGLRNRDGIFYSVAELGVYLSKQPANSPDKPITVAVKTNRKTLNRINAAINHAGKYVSLDLGGSPLKTISLNAFEGCTSLSSVSMPDSVTSIGKETFYGCYNLARVNIPESVTSIGKEAFYGCCNLARVKMPVSITNIEKDTFFGCTSLTSITIPNGVSSIGYRAFSDCESLISVIIPDGVTSIGESAFYNCASLVSVTFQGTIQSSKFSNEDSFPGDLREKFYAADKDKGTPGIYTRDPDGDTWTLQ